MKKYQIVVDSSSDMLNTHFNDENILFTVVPLTIKVDEKEYIDNDDLNTRELLDAVNAFKGLSTSSCPSMGLFEEAYKKAQNTITITITNSLSGTYNAARVAAQAVSTDGHNVIVIDSLFTSGVIQLIAEECYELMKQDLELNDIAEKLNKFTEGLKLYFILDRFDNLIKNGRISKLSGLLAGFLNIKPIATGIDGKIVSIDKKRTTKAALKRVMELIGDLSADVIATKNLLINHVFNNEIALWIKEEVEKLYNFKSIRIVETRGLCTYYALDNGIIISF